MLPAHPPSTRTATRRNSCSWNADGLKPRTSSCLGDSCLPARPPADRVPTPPQPHTHTRTCTAPLPLLLLPQKRIDECGLKLRMDFEVADSVVKLERMGLMTETATVTATGVEDKMLQVLCCAAAPPGPRARGKAGGREGGSRLQVAWGRRRWGGSWEGWRTRTGRERGLHILQQGAGG